MPIHADHTSHVQPVSLYLKVYVALVFLLVITVAAAYIPQLNRSPLGLPVAMVIAITKATMVVLIFMNVKFSSRLVWVWASLGFIWLFLLLSTVSDFVVRAWQPVQGWTKP